ncbi:4'-phosphopantetheinyl transferase superfamily protein [Dysgonomonas sp. 511]|uniref:4'-phosphopantetheinyl transferase family protein n=1 Tax=Dysgonomonas sp. 511 TaxID=2302930 RepID=UPI0013D1E499|nr:4'-phosphopantetheinyl transferase superfamily protein [Dysgonomonas sp. 511]NDV78801.1 hypothetical protein [Dysgonomonas sp. 511]
MLYLKHCITDHTSIAIWKVEEPEEDLLSQISRQEWIENIHEIKSPSRRLEILCARILIRELTGEEKEVYYNDSGKPFLADHSYHISVSHTRGYVAVAINKTKDIGLDIEQISDKIKRVRSRLIASDEYINDDKELIHLLLHWSAKEAMFKFLDAEGVDFLNHLFVGRFEPESAGTFSASETRTKHRYNFIARYQVEPDFVLVCLEANS